MRQSLKYPSWCRLVGLIMLGGCGFTPIYSDPAGAPDSAAVSADSAISIAPQFSRLGQIMRNALLDQLAPGGDPGASAPYRLELDYTVEYSDLGFELDESFVRSNVNVRASYALIDVSRQTPLYEGAARSITSYNVVQSDFANLAARLGAEERGAREVSAQIAIDIRLKLFAGRQSARGSAP